MGMGRGIGMDEGDGGRALGGPWGFVNGVWGGGSKGYEGRRGEDEEWGNGCMIFEMREVSCGRGEAENVGGACLDGWGV